MNILLINPPFNLSSTSPYSKTGATLPPLGLLYIASYLRQIHPEYSINVLDSPSFKLSSNDFENKLNEFKPDIIGISIYTTSFPSIIETINTIRNIHPNSKIVAGGPHASILPEECINLLNIDAVVIGEGENTFNLLVEHISQNKDYSTVPNIAYRNNLRIVHTSISNERLDLNNIPIPARDLIDLNLYKPAEGTYKRLPATNMITSRGCPYNCCYCSKSVFGSYYRFISPENIIKEIKHLVSTYGIKEIYFNDDVFTLHNENTATFCNMLIESKIDITWGCSTRANLVNPELLQLMKNSGCISIGYGVESGDGEILKSISKDLSINTLKTAINATKTEGIETRTFYIFGLPGESFSSMKKTFSLAKEIFSDFVIFNFAIPIPGTKLYETALSNNLLKYKSLELYEKCDGAHPLISLTNITDKQLLSFYKRAYLMYYLSPKYILNRIISIKSFCDLKRNIKGLLSFLNWF